MEESLWLKKVTQSVAENKKKKLMLDGIGGLVGFIILGSILFLALIKTPSQEEGRSMLMMMNIFFIVGLALVVKREIGYWKMDPRDSLMKEILRQFPNAIESKQFLDTMDELENNVIETKERDLICNSQYIVEIYKKIGHIGKMNIYQIKDYNRIKIVEYGSSNSAMYKDWKLELEKKEGKKKDKIRLLEPYEADKAEKIARKYYPYLYVE